MEKSNFYYKIVEGHEINYEVIGKRINDEDFSGIYLQCGELDAMRYLEHKANMSQSNKIMLIRFKLNMDYYLLDDKIIGYPNIKQEDKVSIIKELLYKKYNLTITKKLISSLDKPLQVIELVDENIFELIVPHHLFNEINLSNGVILKKFIIKEKYINNINYKYAVECQ
jgi:hypothetical protein